MKYLFLSLLIGAPAFASTCLYTLQSENTKLNWTAFKTPQKVGVKGAFTSFQIKAAAQDSIEKVITSATFTVDSSSVSTGDKGRDAKVAEFFFDTKTKTVAISGKVLSLKDKVAQVEFELNKVKKIVPMKVDINQETATLTGTLDVLNFALDKNLAALTKACEALHQGKTWQDVDVSLEAKFTKACK